MSKHLKMALLLTLSPLLCFGEEQNEDNARTKPIEASNFDDIVNNFGYLLKGVKRVVWILDQSPSMADDIAEVRKRIDVWLTGIDADTQVAVILFSQKADVALPLTKDRAAIKAGFDKYKTEDSSQENMYAAIAEALKMLPGKGGSAILVATDEAGDDEKHLAAAIRECSGRFIQFYAITPHASFGNRIWKWCEHNYQARNTKLYQSANGPESFGPEALYNFHFVQRTNWNAFNHPEDTRIWALDSGFAPFGIYAMTEATQGRVYELKTDTCKLHTSFDEKKIGRYMPDLDAPNSLRNIQRTPWRLAVQQVAEHWVKNFKDIERVYPGAGKAAFNGACARQIPVTQANMRVADTVLDQLAAALKNKQGCRSADASAGCTPHLRWRANLELAYASASVARFHLNQILADFARFKEPAYELPGGADGVYGYMLNCIPSGRVAPENPTGTPDADGMHDMLTAADHTQARTFDKMRTQTEAALDVVIANHKDTPWATMAAQLKAMLGSYEPRVIMAARGRDGWSRGDGNK